MARAARSVELAIQKEADQAARSSTEFLALQAAQSGLGEAAERLQGLAEQRGDAEKAAAVAASAGFRESSEAAESYTARRIALNKELIQSINTVVDAANKQRQSLAAQRDSGAISDDQLKSGLRSTSLGQQDAVNKLKAERDQQLAILQTEAAEEAAIEKRKAATQTLIDKLNGIPPTYRANLAALQASYAAGEVSTKQFQETLDKLNSTRPDIQRYQQQTAAAQAAAAAEIKAIEDAAAADLAANAKRQASTQQLIDKLSGVGSQFRAQADQLQKSLTAGDITPAQFQTSFKQLNDQRPDIQAAKQAQAAAEAAAAAQQKAIEATEAADLAATAQRVAAAQRIIDVQNGVTASYSSQLEELRKLDAEGLISGEQFTRAFNELAAKQPASQQYAAEIAAAKQVADAEQDSVAKRISAFQRLQESVAKLNYKQQAEDQRKAADAAKTLADAETKAADDRVAAAQKEILANAGLNASYAERIKNLVELKKSGNLSDDQFDQAKSRLVAQQPINANPASGSNDAFIASIQRTAEIVGKTRAQVLEYDAAQRGLSASAAPFIAKIAEADANMAKFGRQTGLSVIQLQTLKYTASDVVASLGSGISPFTILLQQGGQVAQIEGGVTGLLKGIGQSITPFVAGVGLASAAVGILGYAFLAGEKQAKAFQDALVLSGNFSGQTAGKFAETAKAIAASGQVSISAARDYGEALVGTGQIAPQVFDRATKAAALYGAATGKNAKDVATDFAAMSDSATKWVETHNKQLNLFSAAEVTHIKELEDGGKQLEAQALIYDKLNDRLSKLEPNLGTLDKALRAVSNTWHGFWDAAFDIGRPETIEDKIAKARAALDKVTENRRNVGQPGEGFQPNTSSRPPVGKSDEAQAAAAEALRLNLAAQRAQQTAAVNQAELEFLNKQASAADSTLQGQLKAAHAAEGLKKALADENALFAQQDALAKIDPAYAQQTAGLRSAQTRAALIKQINESFTDKKGSSEADQARKKQLDQDLKDLQDNLAKEQDALKFNAAQLDLIYKSGTISLDDYYDAKAKAIADGTAKQVAELQAEQRRIEAEQKKPGLKPSEAIDLETQRKKAVEATANVQRDADHAAILAAGERIEATKQLIQQATEFQAQLLQSEGEETKAAQIREQLSLAAANRQKTQSGGAISDDDLARYAKAIEVANQYADIQRQVSIATTTAATAEEAYTLRATQDGTSLFQQERDIYTIRAASLVQLGELADKAALLAAASTDPKVKQFAADLALQYAKAADAVDPALQRLRAAGDQLGSGLASDFADALVNATKLSDVVKGFEKTVVQIIADIGVKQPLETFLKGGFRELTEGSNPVGDFFKKNFASKGVNATQGIGSDSAVKGFSQAKDSQAANEDAAKGATEAQTTATTEATAAIKAQTSALTENTAALKAFLDAKFGTGAGGPIVSTGDNGLLVDKSGLGIDAAAQGYSPASDGAAATAAAKVATSQDASTTANYENSAAAVASAAGFRDVASTLTVLSSATRLASLVMSTFSSTSSSSSASSGLGSLFSIFGGLSGGSSGGALASSSIVSEAGSTLFARGAVFGGHAPVAFAKGGAMDSKQILPFAKGGVFAPIQFGDGDMFDDTIQPTRYGTGGSFTNKVVAQSTLFKFKHGGAMRLGELGEAGPEAIVPLKYTRSGTHGIQSFDKNGRAAGLLNLMRGANGSLGVQAYAKGGIFTRETEVTSPVRKYANGGVFERAVRPVYAFADGGSFTPGGGYEPAPVAHRPQGGSLLAGDGPRGAGNQRTLVVHQNIIVQGGTLDRRTTDQIGQRAYDGARRASLRNG